MTNSQGVLADSSVECWCFPDSCLLLPSLLSPQVIMPLHNPQAPEGPPAIPLAPAGDLSPRGAIAAPNS